MSEDVVNHPSHYTRFKGIEVIQLTEQLNFCKGNAIKYIARAGAKDVSKEIEDLKKAIWYIEREIQRIQGEEPEPAKPYVSPQHPSTGGFYVGDKFDHILVTNNVSTTTTYRPSFDEIMFPEQCQDCDGNCTVCVSS